MKERIDLTMQSAWEKAFSFLMTKYFREEEVEEFLSKRGDGQQKLGETVPVESSRSLREFLEDDLFQEQFKKRWEYETGEQWKGREAGEALFETVGHSLAFIVADAHLFLGRGKEETFPDKSREEVERILDQAGLLSTYLLKKLGPLLPPLPPLRE
jgi:hypothetical protein